VEHPQVDNLKEIVTLVVEFFLEFCDTKEALIISLILLRRLYNFYEDLRGDLEEPIMKVLFLILKAYKLALTKKTANSKEELEIIFKLYSSA